MPVQYDSKKVIPAPFFQISKQYHSTDDGSLIGSVFSITLKGKLIADKGSPGSTGSFWDSSGYPADEVLTADQKFKSILKKQQALRSLFAVHGQSLEIQPWDGSAATKCNPRVKSVDFAEGNWVEWCDYSISLEADRIYLDGVAVEDTEFGGYFVSRASEDWNIEILDETKRTYRLTHSVSAVGKAVYEPDGSLAKKAWERAKDYVVEKIGLGLDTGKVTSALVVGGAAGLKTYNHLRTQQIGELTGTFSVTETWVCYDPGADQPAAYEDWTVSVRAAVSGRTSVSIEGTITGLEERNSGDAVVKSRWENAYAKFTDVWSTLFSRAGTVSGITLNPSAINQSNGLNKVAGTVTYNVEYDNRPQPITPDALSEVVSVTEIGQADVFARVPVLGRQLGPVLQDLQTKTEKKRNISIEIQMPAATMTYSPLKPDTDDLLLSYAPTGTSQLFFEGGEVTWVQQEGRYSRHAAYVWE